MNPSEILEARRAAVEKIVAEQGGYKEPKPDENAVFHRALMYLASDCAGMGFDEGVKWATQQQNERKQ